MRFNFISFASVPITEAPFIVLRAFEKKYEQQIKNKRVVNETNNIVQCILQFAFLIECWRSLLASLFTSINCKSQL